MTANLLQIIESTTFGADQIEARTQRIHAAVLSKATSIDAPNFTRIRPSDLELLFAEYDAAFFDDQMKQSLGAIPLHFSLSQRMTSSGGKTARYVDRSTGKRRYEISVSTVLLFGCFGGDDHRPLTVGGIACRDRLDALQRVMEHELIHLVEMLLWDKSSCAKPRFQSIARRFFGHVEYRHGLVTPKEKAMIQYGIKPGMAVRFRFDGVELKGVVNRINKRATVLVEDRDGERYSDGKHYAKYYIPIPMLEAIE